MRIRKKQWTEDELENSKYLIRKPENFKGNWGSCFGKDAPVHIEIGCGKGGFITALSQKNPDISFIALERASKIIVRSTRKAHILEESGENANNLRFILGDANGLLDYFVPGEVDRIYLNFSDPWPNRKKWQKRRLTHRNFLNIYREILKNDGEIHFKTDNTQLFEFSLNEFATCGWKLSDISLDLHNSQFHLNGENIMTEYEQKFAAGGIYRLVANTNSKLKQ